MKPWLLVLPLLFCAAVAGAEELYRWVDEKGQVTYSDMPPPTSVDDVQQKRFGDRAGTQQLPYALQQATRNFPVTLYISDCGAACEQAPKLLQKRGVPFSQKNAKDPQVAEEMAKLSGGKVFVPLLTVGTSVIKGFEEGAWHSALDVGGYPKSNMLPANVPAKRELATTGPASAETAKP